MVQTRDSDTSAHRFHSDHHPFPLDTRNEIFCFSLEIECQKNANETLTLNK